MKGCWINHLGQRIYCMPLCRIARNQYGHELWSENTRFISISVLQTLTNFQRSNESSETTEGPCIYFILAENHKPCKPTASERNRKPEGTLDSRTSQPLRHRLFSALLLNFSTVTSAPICYCFVRLRAAGIVSRLRLIDDFSSGSPRLEHDKQKWSV